MNSLAETIIQAAAVIGAITAILGVLLGIVKWYLKQEKQSDDIETLKNKEQEDIRKLTDMHSEDIRKLNTELCLITYAMLACLDGLKQLHCNGPVSEAHQKLEKHLNVTAHDQKARHSSG